MYFFNLGKLYPREARIKFPNYKLSLDREYLEDKGISYGLYIDLNNYSKLYRRNCYGNTFVLYTKTPGTKMEHRSISKETPKEILDLPFIKDIIEDPYEVFDRYLKLLDKKKIK